MKSLGGNSSFFPSHCWILNMDETRPYGAMILVPFSFLNGERKNKADRWVRTTTCTHAQAYEFSDSYIATRFVQWQFHVKRVAVFIITFASVIVNYMSAFCE